eukprot:365682-Chlamydomonas_euryale.AAC.21
MQPLRRAHVLQTLADLQRRRPLEVQLETVIPQRAQLLVPLVVADANDGNLAAWRGGWNTNGARQGRERLRLQREVPMI